VLAAAALSPAPGPAYGPLTAPDGGGPVPDEQSVNEETPQTQTLVEETLVEEVSIDGMCGVY
jgi:mycofactocin precursor